MSTDVDATQELDFDVAVVGYGLVGQALAALLVTGCG